MVSQVSEFQVGLVKCLSYNFCLSTKNHIFKGCKNLHFLKSRTLSQIASVRSFGREFRLIYQKFALFLVFRTSFVVPDLI